MFGFTVAEGVSELTVRYEHNQHSHSEGNYKSQHPSALTLMQFAPSPRTKECGNVQKSILSWTKPHSQLASHQHFIRLGVSVMLFIGYV